MELYEPSALRDFSFVLMLTSLTIIGVLKKFYWKHSKLYYSGVFAQRYSNQFLREENAFTERVRLFTFSLMIINVSLLFFKVFSVTEINEALKIIFLLLGFFLAKIFLISCIGLLFKNYDVAKLTVFFTMLYDKFLGIVLFPIVIVIYFFIYDISNYLIGFSFFLFTILILIKFYCLIKIGSRSFGFPKKYIFLYLCMVEISPFILFLKGIFY